MTEIAPVHHSPQGDSPAASHPEARGIQGANGDVGETSRNLLASVNDLHVQSTKRNSNDSKQDSQAIQGDRDSLKQAVNTAGLTEQVKSYLDKGGNFSDAQGKELGTKLIAGLRQQRDDNTGDSQTDLQYAGPQGIFQKQSSDALTNSKSIADSAAKLADPNTTPEARAALLKDIGDRANAIGQGLADKSGTAGKDQKDAVSESQVISGDVAALQSGKLTPEQSKELTADIASKAALVQKEVKDAPDEIQYAQHDSQANKAGADLEAVVRSAMQSSSPKALQQLSGLIDGYHNQDGTGALDKVAVDRTQDLSKEPRYIAANNADNANNNKAILEFTNPYR